mmetsp:Transcript_91635/g.245494  ORF Transcript_91635/g.245494 Transcript_91635/m.245494 type:complete len:276 (+) Transcript_91635:394-1221(+)
MLLEILHDVHNHAMSSRHIAPELIRCKGLDEPPGKSPLHRALNGHLRAVLEELASGQGVDAASRGVGDQRLRGVPYWQGGQIQEPRSRNVVPQLAVVHPPSLNGAVHRRGHMLRVHVGHHTVARVQQQGNLDCWREPLKPVQDLQKGDQSVLPALRTRRAHGLAVQPGLLRCFSAQGGVPVAVHYQMVVEEPGREVITIVARHQIGFTLICVLAAGVLRTVPSKSKEQAVPCLRPGNQPIQRVENGISRWHFARLGVLIHQNSHLVLLVLQGVMQ